MVKADLSGRIVKGANWWILEGGKEGGEDIMRDDWKRNVPRSEGGKTYYSRNCNGKTDGYSNTLSTTSIAKRHCFVTHYDIELLVIRLPAQY